MNRPTYSGESIAPLAEIEDELEEKGGVMCLGGPLKGKRIVDTGNLIHVYEKHVYLRTRVNLQVGKYGQGAHEYFFILEGLEGLIEMSGEP